MAKRRRNKYKNVKSGGYDSKKEHRRATELKLLEKAGEISDLKEQVVFELLPSQYREVDGKRKCIEKVVKYIADFSYIENGEYIVEDVKSQISKTPAYVIKRKLMLFLHDIVVRET